MFMAYVLVAERERGKNEEEFRFTEHAFVPMRLGTSLNMMMVLCECNR